MSYARSIRKPDGSKPIIVVELGQAFIIKLLKVHRGDFDRTGMIPVVRESMCLTDLEVSIVVHFDIIEAAAKELGVKVL